MVTGRVLASASDTERTPAHPGWNRAEIAFALGASTFLCIAVLTAAPFLVEPADWAYRASILAMTQGHFLTLTAAQAHALALQLAGGHPKGGPPGRPGLSPPPIPQWVRLPGGRWISEKDPGYPFLAAPFQALGAPRVGCRHLPSPSGSGCPAAAGSVRRIPATPSSPPPSRRWASSAWHPCSTEGWPASACSAGPAAGWAGSAGRRRG